MSSYFVATRSAKLIRRGTKAMRKETAFRRGLRQDPDFFAFYRSMQTNETGLKGGDTRIGRISSARQRPPRLRRLLPASS
jgi:hypothetical protein